jgi:glycosyltransferase involved in cell wall biosynthesis
VVFAGRLETVKAPLSAVGAMLELPADSQARLFVLGDGPMMADVSALSRHPALRSKVTLLGFRSDALRFVAHADAVLLPSLHEGLPFVALEALACGTPLIASEVGGLREFLVHGRDVYFTAPGDTATLAKGISILERDPALRSTLGKNGVELINRELSADRMVDRYLATYQKRLTDHEIT